MCIRWLITYFICSDSRSRWPRSLTPGSAATCLFGTAGSNPAGDMDVSCECCVFYR